MNYTELLIETLLTGGTFGGLFSVYKWWQNRRDKLKKEKQEKEAEEKARKLAIEARERNADAWKNSERICTQLYDMLLTYSASYVHILIFHNGGRHITTDGEKKVTVRYEIKKEYHLKDKQAQYNKFECDYGFIHAASILSRQSEEEFYIINDVSDLRSSKFKRFFNKHEGKVIIMKRICWIGDNLIAFCMQLDRIESRDLLSSKQMDSLKHEIDLLDALFSNSKKQIIQQIKENGN